MLWFMFINDQGLIMSAIQAPDMSAAINKAAQCADWLCVPASGRLWLEAQRQRADVLQPGQTRVMRPSWLARLRARFGVSAQGVAHV